MGARLERLIEEMGGRLLLIRQAARNTVGDDPLTVLVSGGFDEEGWLTRFEVGDAKGLVEWLDSWRQAGMPSPQDTVAEPVLLVCTHAKRDRCCALEGRPILEELEGELGVESLWECSHLGGHRFAPTALLLPTGQVLGRMVAGEALAAYRDAGVGLLWPGGERRDGDAATCPRNGRRRRRGRWPGSERLALRTSAAGLRETRWRCATVSVASACGCPGSTRATRRR